MDIFDTNGNLVKTFAKGGPLNAPWGIAEAPFNFGRFSNALLVGNFGNGRISAYNLATRKFIGQLRDSSEKPVTIDGLWSLSFAEAQGADPGTLYFTAGPNNQTDGLFGSLSPQ